jgi:hypothetical protein
MRSFHPLLLLLIASATCNGDTPTGPASPASIGLQEIASGLQFPVLVTSPPRDTSRLFVVEKRGVIRLIRNGALLPTPFLDVRNKVSTGSEQGLLGLAFHPNYASNGVFVLDYTDTQGDTRVATMKVSSNADIADPASEQVFLSVDQPFANHNGGHVTFGPLGYLFVGLGDGGSGGDPGNRAQNLSLLLGKLLRYAIDDQGRASVPQGNPFVGQAGTRGEIWSYGLRNPWRFSFDRVTGDLYVGDVGQDRIEEIDVVTSDKDAGRGANFGWRIMEGSSCYSPAAGCDVSGKVLPTLEYTHAEGCSVTGGHVYRGQAIPALVGQYFYGDYCQGWIRSFRHVNGTATEQRERAELDPNGEITSFGEDASGELYVTTAGGKVFRIVGK